MAVWTNSITVQRSGGERKLLAASVTAASAGSFYQANTSLSAFQLFVAGKERHENVGSVREMEPARPGK